VLPARPRSVAVDESCLDSWVDDRELGAELVARMALDQTVRTTSDPEVARRMGEVDADNTAWLKTVLAERGWPAQSVVGTAAAEATWLLAQHADADPDFQQRCLSLLGAAVRADEASPTHQAYLTDRMLRACGEPQRFGTQFWTGPDGSGELVAAPIEDIDHLDQRRAAVGLGPFAEYQGQVIDSYRQDD
jgi:hypothetical protein